MYGVTFCGRCPMIEASCNWDMKHMFLILRTKRALGQSILVISAIALVLAGPAHAAEEPAPLEEDSLATSIVLKADQVRFPKESFEVSVSITSTSEGATPEVRTYRVLSKGNENTIVMVTEPASDRGQILLMKGHDLWMFLPTVSQSVRLSMAQRLTGQVANGDIAKANFSGDYRAKVLRTEKIDGEQMYVLELLAAERSVAYQRVLYWVRQANHWPYKAEFYTSSERLLKTCHYRNFKPMAGRVRPTQLVMQDALRKGNESVLEYSDMRLKDLPDRMFSKDYLKRLE
jgi:outer membrane lipoprotein-sorting protein